MCNVIDRSAYREYILPEVVIAHNEGLTNYCHNIY